MYIYEVRPRKDKRGVNLISDALPFGRLWCGEPNAVINAIDFAKFYSRSHDALIRVYDAAGNVFETHEQIGEFKHRYRARHRSETIPLPKCRIGMALGVCGALYVRRGFAPFSLWCVAVLRNKIAP